MAFSANVVVKHLEHEAVVRRRENLDKHPSSSKKWQQESFYGPLYCCLDTQTTDLSHRAEHQQTQWSKDRRIIAGGTEAHKGSAALEEKDHGTLPLPEVHVRFEHSIDHVPTLSVRLTWPVEGHEDFISTASIFYVPANIISKHSDDPEPVYSVKRIEKPSDLSARSNYPGLSATKLQELCSSSLFEIQVSGHGRKDLSKTYSQRMHLQNAEAKTYGAHRQLFQSVRELLDFDHTVRILTTSSVSSRDAEHWVDKVTSYRENDLSSKWTRASSAQYTGEESATLSPPAWPKYSMVPKATFFNWEELLIVETHAQLAEIVATKQVEYEIKKLKARVVLPSSARNTVRNVSRMRLVVDRASVAHNWPRDATKARKELAARRLEDLQTAGTRVEVFFYDLGYGEDIWSGRIIAAQTKRPRQLVLELDLPLHNHDDYYDERYDEYYDNYHGGEYLGEIKNSCAFGTTAQDLDDVWPCDIDIRVLDDSHTIKRTFRQAERLYLEMAPKVGPLSSPTKLETILCASRFDKLHRVDMYADVDPKYVESLRRKFVGFRDQRHAIALSRGAPGGVLLVAGFAGTGKTTFLVHAILPLYKQHKKQPSFKFKLLVASALNTGCDIIADALAKTGMNVIRLFANSTEQAIAKKHIRQPPVGIFDLEVIESHGSLHGVFTAESVHIAMGGSFSLPPKDKRVVREQLQNSLGWKVLWSCGIVPGAEQPTSTERIKFRDLYRQLTLLLGRPRFLRTQSEAEFEQILLQLDVQLETISASLIRDADAVVTTFALATEARLTDVFEATHLVFDDAAKVQSLEVMGLWAFYPSAPVFMYGDPLQTQPIARASYGDSPFAAQISLPLFTRLLINGFEHVLFKDAIRPVASISRFLSKAFCEGRLLMAIQKIDLDASNVTAAAMRKRLLRLFIPAPTLSTQGSVLGLALRDSECLNSSEHKNSRFNRSSLAHVWKALEHVFASGYKPTDVAIISSYRAQTELHHEVHDAIVTAKTAGKTKAFPEVTADQLKELTVSTVDTLPSMEREVVIYDTVATDRKAFVNDKDRCYAACSRARQVLFIVHDVKLFATAESPSPFVGINRYLSKHKLDIDWMPFRSDADRKDSKFYKAANFRRNTGDRPVVNETSHHLLDLISL